MIYTFKDLKKKDVVNVIDGKNLGKINDLIIDAKCGQILKIVVSGKKFGSLFCDNIEINFNKITKIGEDSILVKLCLGKNDLTTESEQVLNIEEDE